MSEKLKKIGKAILKVLALATQIFKVYKLFTRGGDCEKGKDEHKNERAGEKETGENTGKAER